MKAEIANRLAKAHRFLDEAEKADPGESPLSIAHDAYYAMFHAALAVLVRNMEHPPTKHGAVIGEFGRLVKDFGDDARRMGRSINDAQELRINADYAPEGSPTTEDAAAAREDAHAFVAFCESLLDETLDR